MSPHPPYFFLDLTVSSRLIPGALSFSSSVRLGEGQTSYVKDLADGHQRRQRLLLIKQTRGRELRTLREVASVPDDAGAPGRHSAIAAATLFRKLSRAQLV